MCRQYNITTGYGHVLDVYRHCDEHDDPSQLVEKADNHSVKKVQLSVDFLCNDCVFDSELLETPTLPLEGSLKFPLEGENARFQEYARSRSTWKLPDERLEWLQQEFRAFQTSFKLKMRENNIDQASISVGKDQIKLLGVIIQHNLITKDEDEFSQKQPALIPYPESLSSESREPHQCGDNKDHITCYLCEEKIKKLVDGFTEYRVRMPCGHVFGNFCIETWLEMSDGCPICRWRFPRSFYFTPSEIRAQTDAKFVSWIWLGCLPGTKRSWMNGANRKN